MNKLLKHIFWGDVNIKEYVPITLGHAIKQSVHLIIEDMAINVSEDQWLLSLYPAVWGIWITNEKAKLKDYSHSQCEMIVNGDREKPVAKLSLTFLESIAAENGSLLLFKIGNSSLYHINPLKTRLLFHKFYKKDHFTFENLKSFAAAYSYPRRVRLVSYKEHDYYNIFPMDLLGKIPGSNKFVLGLRHTNIVLSKIMTTKKLVVCNVGFEHKDLVYKLGKHHGISPPLVEELPFNTVLSQKFKFYLPAWTDNYAEIKILKTIDLGSHMLLWGEIVNEIKSSAPENSFFHIHYLLQLYQKRKRSDSTVI